MHFCNFIFTSWVQPGLRFLTFLSVCSSLLQCNIKHQNEKMKIILKGSFESGAINFLSYVYIKVFKNYVNAVLIYVEAEHLLLNYVKIVLK